MATEEDRNLSAAVERGHESTDASVKGLFIFAGALLASILIILLAVEVPYRVSRAVNAHAIRRQAAAEPGARSLVRTVPDYTGPLLQVTPEEDLKWMLAHETHELETYGWVDHAAGVVRLPIDRAMDLIVARGLPPVSPGVTMEALQRQRAQPQVWGQALRP